MLKYLPNMLTLLRGLLIIPIVLAITHQRTVLAVSLFVLASLSDLLDGYCARRYGWQTRLGAVLDPIADKALLMTTFITLTTMDALPLWLTVVVILRDSIIILGAAICGYRTGLRAFKLRILGKFATATQMGLVLSVLCQAWGAPSLLSSMLIPITAALTISSGVQYLGDGWQWYYRQQ